MEDYIDEKAAISKINSSKIVWKFKFYGFFKNLQFFEPFIILIFLNWNYTFLQIGLFIMIREIFTYLFEIPSGILADKHGMKNELLLCFLFYIFSFIFYFFGKNVLLLIIASMLFGLGEAFRSGTHKAMELKWMEKENLLNYKSLIYGKTRSWSLYGSALNSILAIVIILIIPAENWIFILATIPFIIDFVLIYSYPDYMNLKIQSEKIGWYKQLKLDFISIFSIFKNKQLRIGIISSASFDSIFKSIKDFIQPIMKVFIGILLIDMMLEVSQEDLYVKVILGIIYAIFYIVSALSSKNAYRLTKKNSDYKKAIDILFDIFALLLLFEAIFIWLKIPIGIILLYMAIYAAYNLRRPILVGYIGELSPKDQRTTVLSVESQFKSMLMFIFAPLFGYIADEASIQTLFLVLTVLILLFNSLFLKSDKINETNNSLVS